MNLFKSKIDADKAVIHNVIILDRSGSMDSIRQQAVGGVNEMLQSIRVQQRENPEVTHLVTLVAFCGCDMFRRERQARKEWSDKMAQLMKDRDNLSHEELMQLKRHINAAYFDE